MKRMGRAHDALASPVRRILGPDDAHGAHAARAQSAQMVDLEAAAAGILSG
jgi:hypothetical protein